MKRHEWWREQYHQDAYLEILDSAALGQRTTDVIDNQFLINDESKVAFHPVGPEGEYWMIAWTHLLEEWNSRGGIPLGLAPPIVPKLDWRGLSDAARSFNESRKLHPNVLVRYGEARFMRALFERGEVLVKPASKYDDASLNPAIRDDELSLDIYVRSPLFGLAHDRHGSALRPAAPIFGRIIRTLRAPTNYYVYCMAAERRTRLFADFGYDAAVIIHRPKVFIRRLGAAISEHLGGWNWFATPIEYIDPLRPSANELDIVRCKHFRYAYQREYRLVWLPPQPQSQLSQFSLSIGSLADCASLLELVPAG
jgi:hypothetical protein